MSGSPLHAIFVCVGGGGLISGIGAFLKRVRPNVKIIGVEANDAASMTISLQVVGCASIGLVLIRCRDCVV